MKFFLVTCFSVFALLPLCAVSQQLSDSVFQKQLIRQKLQLKLTDSQFENYKKVSKTFLEKMSMLTATAKDTAAYINEAVAMQKKFVLKLSEILNAEQVELYKKANAAGWQNFRKNAEQNHIKTFANGGGNNN